MHAKAHKKSYRCHVHARCKFEFIFFTQGQYCSWFMCRQCETYNLIPVPCQHETQMHSIQQQKFNHKSWLWIIFNTITLNALSRSWLDKHNCGSHRLRGKLINQLTKFVTQCGWKFVTFSCAPPNSKAEVARVKLLIVSALRRILCVADSWLIQTFAPVFFFSNILRERPNKEQCFTCNGYVRCLHTVQNCHTVKNCGLIKATVWLAVPLCLSRTPWRYIINKFGVEKQLHCGDKNE